MDEPVSQAQFDSDGELSERCEDSLETMSKEETLRARLKHVGPSVTLFFAEDPLKMVRGRGQYLYDEQGTEYLDCINNVAHVGHANRRVQEALSKQLSLVYTNSRFLHDSLSAYARRLVATFPAHLSVCYLVNSGSEANDLAMRLARAYTGRKDIGCVEGAYHGNLSSTMAISPYKTSQLARGGRYQAPKWVHVAPLPCAYRGRITLETRRKMAQSGDPEMLGRQFAADAERVLERGREERGGRELAAFFVESMISCGGQTPLPAGYLQQLSKYVQSRGALLVCDEVQTGFGRSGKHMWAFQMAGPEVRPDIVTLGKPMGNGFPCAAVVTTPQVAGAFKALGTEYFNTYGGNAASCVAGLAVLDELEARQLQRHARDLGAEMLAELRSLQQYSSYLGDVRGAGFFIGLEMVRDLKTREPAPELAQRLVRHFRRARILMSTEGLWGNVLKFKPPMVFQRHDARRFIDTLAAGLLELEQDPLLVSDARPPAATKQRSSSTSSACSSASSVSSAFESSCEL